MNLRTLAEDYRKTIQPVSYRDKFDIFIVFSAHDCIPLFGEVAISESASFLPCISLERVSQQRFRLCCIRNALSSSSFSESVSLCRCHSV
uniref:Uncharacterized protein n=1 Tax=Parascaris univalens TaxID=6257 RepID=A0A915BAV2_PARUN